MRNILLCASIILLVQETAANPLLLLCPDTASTGCSSTYGTELHVAANAAAPSASDTDAITGFSQTGLATWDSIDTSPYLGTYHLTAVANSDGDRLYYDTATGLTSGSLYRLRTYVRHNGTGGDWIMGFGVSSAGAQTSQSKIIATEDTTYFAYDRYFYSTPYTAFFIARESESDNGGIYLDAFSLTPVTTPCLGPELYTAANAASISNEANAAAVTGWTNTTVDTFASVSTNTPDNGTYHLEIAEVATPTSSARVTFDLSTLSLVDGTSYLISIKAKHSGTGETWNIALNASDATSTSNTIATVPVANTSYLIKGMEFVYSSSVRYLVIYEAGAAVESRIYVDSISVKEILSK